MAVPTFVSNTAIIIGNGESRAWYTPSCGNGINYRTWGCNAIYRDGEVDNLVATDYNMEQEIYASGYAEKHTCWFTDWNILPGNIADTFLMGYDIPEKFVFQNSHIGRTSCVIQGKDPATVQEKIDEAIKRIENETYGYCEETGDHISIKRLEARLIATLSLEAQEAHEKKERTKIKK